MPITIVVGGQYGSEGKGKTVAALSLLSRSPHVVRCGGPNSGHTIHWQGRDVILRQVPAGVVNNHASLYLAAGSVVDVDVITNELDTLALPNENIMVDERAIIVNNSHKVHEMQAEASRIIGSTCSGNGAALAQRLMRASGVILAHESPRLIERVKIGSVASEIHKAIEKDETVIVEGTQGFGLSLFHGPHYPYVTSKDTTAAGFASEVGISPRDVTCIIMVVRTFPIRVGGKSGPLPFETSWENIREAAGVPRDITEYTSVTKRVRRVGRFDFEIVKMAARYNRPNAIALLGLDLLDYKNATARGIADLTSSSTEFVTRLETVCGAPVFLFGTGQSANDYFIDPNRVKDVLPFQIDSENSKLTA
jgi:adenylosuccinate synthase